MDTRAISTNLRVCTQTAGHLMMALDHLKAGEFEDVEYYLDLAEAEKRNA
jgi:hypothetical protein